MNVCVILVIEFMGVYYVGLFCESVEKLFEFYCGLLGMFFLCLVFDFMEIILFMFFFISRMFLMFL